MDYTPRMIKDLRRSLYLSQSELAEHVEGYISGKPVNRSHIARAEAGREVSQHELNYIGSVLEELQVEIDKK